MASFDHLYSPEWQRTHKKTEKYNNNKNSYNLEARVILTVIKR